ncbi:hypothetical protein NX786_14080 [Telluria mixta]|uniref:SH3 domain-containing protein n=1 Tax=Telluria mixta TaxID=34071 RepID=A0ABT2BZ99_9BURK|nr:hypothetical protein [Telluria mixta]MCS0630464.1 hypothetical protein [Telluria mixta]WEM94233.1 hypothetical protein P0M04_22420 [Telluria mixta]
MATKIMRLLFLLLLFSQSVFAGESIDGKSYTNFGWDLDKAIFPANGILNIYRNKGDSTPAVTLKDKPVINQSGAVDPCIKKTTDDWTHCKVSGTTGWIKNSEFMTAEEHKPVSTWPFRYWLYIASTSTGGEEAVMLERIVPKNPYLIAPAAYSNIFFYVLFDKEGRAISPKTHKPTGDRVFLAGDAVYLAPEDPKRRKDATWLFLNFYNTELNAMCPGRTRNSCMTAVNSGSDWPGIKRMHEEPAEQYKRKDDSEEWFGNGEVAFARHIDPVQPLMYRIPDDVVMKIDSNPITKAQIAKNREKLVCIADCY